jgi:hypothetical protein
MLQDFLTAMGVFISNSFVKRSIGSDFTSARASRSPNQLRLGTAWNISRVLLGGGYMRDRGTGMSDLVITSRPLLLDILGDVEPHVIFKKEHVRRALEILPQLERVKDPEVFLQLAREVDAFATLNYSKTKRIFAVDVERHLRSTGVLCPCNDFFASNSEEMASLG